MMIGFLVLALGIIPALAGNTCRANCGFRYRKDHPRSRGEYLCRDFVALTADGSSPLSRGIRWLTPEEVSRVRIIPALAGNTSWLVS